MEHHDFIAFYKKSDAVYQKFCQNVIREWEINVTCFQIIMFFANNPKFNTARDLCRMRGIKTGIASVSIEQMIQAGYLERKTDQNDRRIQRLFVTEKAEDLVRRGREVQREFAASVSLALTEEELRTYFRLNEKIMQRIDELDRNM